MQTQDMKSLHEFWNWADQEKPSATLFAMMTGVQGKMTDEAQEAVDTAVEILERQCANPNDLKHRGTLKTLSCAILQAWESTPLEHVPEVEPKPCTLVFDLSALCLPDETMRALINGPWPEDEKYLNHGRVSDFVVDPFIRDRDRSNPED